VGAEEAVVKPAPFEYVAPRTVAEALEALAGEDARVLAGGQSLVPLLNFRLARPARLVDINGIETLAYLRRSAGALHIGATVRQAAVERSAIVARHWPLLAQAVRHVAHAAVRARGTVAGSVAHADPKAELPVALAVLDARFHLRSPGGTRTLTAEQLFLGPLTTAIGDGELLERIEVPPLPEGATAGFAEYARTHGDFAEAAVAIVRSPERTTIGVLGPRTATAADPASAAQRAVDLIDDPFHQALTARLIEEALA
jgi:CO/xanthine dehydrogenase FAD-binding subunit